MTTSALWVAALVALGVTPAEAQTDFYNTSAGRPLRIEDANPVEYHAIELTVVPFRVDLMPGRRRTWSLHPETTIGVLPRTQLQIAVPVTGFDARSAAVGNVTGLEISTLHAFNIETAIPALSVVAAVSLPAGRSGGDNAYGTFKGIMTRTLSWARFHANAQFSLGPGAPAREDDRELSRWLAGVAVDKVFPLHSLVVMAETYAERPLPEGDNQVAWTAGAGLRYQLSTRWATDAGVGRRLSGDDRGWHLTFGSAYGFGFR